jgi:hypothetical protein
MRGRCKEGREARRDRKRQERRQLRVFYRGNVWALRMTGLTTAVCCRCSRVPNRKSPAARIGRRRDKRQDLSSDRRQILFPTPHRHHQHAGFHLPCRFSHSQFLAAATIPLSWQVGRFTKGPQGTADLDLLYVTVVCGWAVRCL